MKASYEIRAQKFIEKIHPYLKDFEIDRPGYFPVYGAIGHFNIENHRKVKVCQGVSRYALITSDYVIKIDKYTRINWGTSEDEVFAYNKAKEQGMEHLLVKITPYQYGGRTYYIMPKVLLCKNNRRKTAEAWDELSRQEKRFIEAHFWDLHDENVGIYHGEHVLLDYAANDFEEEEEEEDE